MFVRKGILPPLVHANYVTKTHIEPVLVTIKNRRPESRLIWSVGIVMVGMDRRIARNMDFGFSGRLKNI